MGGAYGREAMTIIANQAHNNGSEEMEVPCVAQLTDTVQCILFINILHQIFGGRGRRRGVPHDEKMDLTGSMLL